MAIESNKQNKERSLSMACAALLSIAPIAAPIVNTSTVFADTVTDGEISDQDREKVIPDGNILENQNKETEVKDEAKTNDETSTQEFKDLKAEIDKFFEQTSPKDFEDFKLNKDELQNKINGAKTLDELKQEFKAIKDGMKINDANVDKQDASVNEEYPEVENYHIEKGDNATDIFLKKHGFDKMKSGSGWKLPTGEFASYKQINDFLAKYGNGKYAPFSFTAADGKVHLNGINEPTTTRTASNGTALLKTNASNVNNGLAAAGLGLAALSGLALVAPRKKRI